MPPLNIGMRIPACAPAPEVARYIRHVEGAGFAFAGVLDSQLLVRDPFVVLALAAAQTSHIRLYTAVTNPVTRHISALAGAAQTLYETAPGRVGIILGSGYSAVQTIGQRAATVDQMRQAVLTLRRLLAGEDIAFGAARSHLRFGGDQHPPVYIAATGPRMVELAGEVADGVLLATGLHPQIQRVALEHLEAGARRAGRSADTLQVIHYVRTQVNEDMNTARTMVRPMCAQWVVEGYRAHWLRVAGLDIPSYDQLPEELLKLYPDIIHAEDWEQAKRATAFLSDDLVAQICDAVGLVGTPEHCARRLEELARSGVRNVFLMTLDTYTFPEATVQVYRERVFPQLAS